jgi:hypothetical protein
VVNSNFYIVSASVIPVFFLALTLQGRQFDDAEHSMRKLTQSIKEHLDQCEKAIVEKKGIWQPYFKLVKASVAFILISGIASVILVISVLGEVFAILVLYQGKGDEGDQTIVLVAVLSLTIGVGLLLYIRLQMLQGENTLMFIRWTIRFVKLMIMLAIRPARQSETPHAEDTQDQHAGD